MSTATDDFVTRCPHCDSAFRVTAGQLQAADGQVRCGQCLTAFDARQHASGSQMTFELLPDDEDRTRRTALSLDFPDDSGIAPLRDGDHDALMGLEQPVELTAPGRARQPLRVAGQAALVTLLLVVLLLQVFWHERERLAAIPATRPAVDSLCGLLGCQVPPFRDLSALRTTGFSLRSQPGDATLLLTVTLHNDAALPQALPGLDLAFTDAQGEMVAARRFLPGEYINAALRESWADQSDASDLPALPAGGSLDVRLLLADPGREAVNYELALSQL